MKTEIKTLDIQALSWFDKINGNSYFAAIVTVNFGLPDSRQYKLPYQYGYGDHYIDMAKNELEKKGEIKDLEHYSNGSSQSLWQWCKDRGIILRTSKQENCLKRDLKNI